MIQAGDACFVYNDPPHKRMIMTVESVKFPLVTCLIPYGDEVARTTFHMEDLMYNTKSGPVKYDGSKI